MPCVIKKVMKTYPIYLNNLSNQRVVVIGGGKVALRKTQGLLEAGASITLISPKIIQALVELSKTEPLKLIQRDYLPGDLKGVFLVIAATNDPSVNLAIWDEAQEENCLVNVVDDPTHCNFIIPAQVRHGDFSIAVSTGGASPALARRLREQLELEFGSEYGDLTALLQELRPVLLTRFPPGKARLNAALKLVDSDLMKVMKQDGYVQARCFALRLLDAGTKNE